MICFPLEYKGKKFCIPVLYLLPYNWPFPWPPRPVGPDDRMPSLDSMLKELNLSTEAVHAVTGLAIVEHGISLLPQAQQAAFRDTFTKVVTEQQRLGLPVQASA